MKKKYNSTDSIPHRAGHLAGQLESRRRTPLCGRSPTTAGCESGGDNDTPQAASVFLRHIKIAACSVQPEQAA